MVKINLLAGQKKKTKPVPAFVWSGAALLALAVVVTFYSNYFMKGKIDSLALQKSRNENTIVLLRSKIQEVKKYERLIKKFKERKRIIEDLRRNQAVPVMVLDEISARLTEGVWLSGLNIMRNDIRMSGFGFTNDNVVAFVQNLKGSSLFTDVYLEGTSKAASEGAGVYRFSLTMKVRGEENGTGKGKEKGKGKA
ncbi:MAG: PilN domain-containing protein [Nitrospiraceae bacterium]|nr:PilN domain-containing protein [Nitrospiraceae bacterium]